MLDKYTNISQYKASQQLKDCIYMLEYYYYIRIWSYSLITRLSKYSDLYKTEYNSWYVPVLTRILGQNIH